MRLNSVVTKSRVLPTSFPLLSPALYSSLPLRHSVIRLKTQLSRRQFCTAENVLFNLESSHCISSLSVFLSLSVWHDRNPPPQFPTFRSLIPQTHSMCSIPIVTQTFKTVTLCFAQPELRAHLKKTGKSIFLIRIPCWCAWGALLFLLFLSVFYSLSHSFFFFFQSFSLVPVKEIFMYFCMISIWKLPKYWHETGCSWTPVLYVCVPML